MIPVREIRRGGGTRKQQQLKHQQKSLVELIRSVKSLASSFALKVLFLFLGCECLRAWKIQVCNYPGFVSSAVCFDHGCIFEKSGWIL